VPGNIIDINQATQAPTIDPGRDPAGFVRRVVAMLAEVGLVGELRRSRELLDRAEALAAAARAGRRAAEVRWAAEQQRLVGTGPIEPERLLEALEETRPWLDADVEQGRSAPAMAALMSASERCRSNALHMAGAEASGIYARLQQVAADVVGRVANLPALPAQVWSALPAQAANVAITSGHEHTWSALVHDGTRFHTVHLAGEMLRATGGLGVWSAGACPEGVGTVWRRWERAQDGHQAFRRLPGPLRLPHAIREGWEPGLWTAADITGRPAEANPRRGLLAIIGGR
jgi:hypothetical protein